MKKLLTVIIVLILVSLACSATNTAVENLVDGVTDKIGEVLLEEFLPSGILTQMPREFLTELPSQLQTLQPDQLLTQLPIYLTQLPANLLTPQPAAVQTGSISGPLSYPSEMIPSMMVVATNTANNYYYYVITAENQGNYLIDNLPPGTYTVIAYASFNDLPGAYSQMVPCGLLYTCTDHSLIPVTVVAGQDSPNIHPGDWYADEGTFPPKPAP